MSSVLSVWSQDSENQVTNLSELLMLSVLLVWSQDSENQVSVYLSLESCVCYPYPFHGVIFMVDD